MSYEAKINCPKCQSSIDVNSILCNRLQTELQSKFNSDLETERKKYQKNIDDFQNEKIEFENNKQRENELFQNRLDMRLKEEKALLETSIKSKIKNEKSEQFSLLQQELNEKSDQVKELNKSKTQIEKLKREKDELKSSIEADAQRQLSETLTLEKDKIKKAEQLKMSSPLKSYKSNFLTKKN